MRIRILNNSDYFEIKKSLGIPRDPNVVWIAYCIGKLQEFPLRALSMPVVDQCRASLL